MANKKEGKIGLEFYCIFCNVKCRDNYNLKKHIDTDKHKRLTMTNKKEGFIFYCECGKNYKHSSSLSKHKKTCSIYLLNICNNDNIYDKCDTSTDIINSNNNDNDNIIDNNNELLNLVKEQNKKIEKLEQTIKDNTNNNIINNYSNNFNLNVFLNEKCKDAININEFQESLKEAITDISNVLNISNTDGITNVLNLTYNKIDNYKKPYYSLDKSRQQLIIKDINNKWVKDTELLFDIIKPLENKYNKKQLYNFYKKLEDKNNITDKQEDEFTNIILNTTCEINKTKLIKNIINNGLNPKSI
jgi:hypothetical protein|tara:strand:- start:3310 stop:4212 length:903 start_codon:yes stop_codon:yes gene_type:complete